MFSADIEMATSKSFDILMNHFKAFYELSYKKRQVALRNFILQHKTFFRSFLIAQRIARIDSVFQKFMLC